MKTKHDKTQVDVKPDADKQGNTDAHTDTNIDTALPNEGTEDIKDTDSPNKSDKGEAPVAEDKPINHFENILLEGKGRKLSPKTTNCVFFEIAKRDTDAQLYLRLSGNEGGGLHSKEWILLKSLIDILDQQSDKPFKSLILKPLFKGNSANNVGFLAGSLRSEPLALLKPAEKGVFLHLLHDDYQANRVKLFALGNTKAVDKAATK